MTSRLPLEGIDVVVTRPEDGDGPLTRLLGEAGAGVLHWVVLRFEPPEDPSYLTSALEELESFDWIVFTSPRAVAAVVGERADPPDDLRVAAVGTKTAAALAEAGWPVERIATDPGGASLARELGEAGMAGARVLFPASAIARRELPDGLRAMGAEVVQVAAYRTVAAPLDRERCRERIDSPRPLALTFASPSAVRGLHDALGEELFSRLRERAPAVALGPTTGAELASLGTPPETVAGQRTLEGLVAAVVHLSNHHPALARRPSDVLPDPATPSTTP